MHKSLKKGDWIAVAGDGTTAYQVVWVTEESVGLSSGWSEPIHKIKKLDPEKFKIVTRTVNKWSTVNEWRRRCKSLSCCYYDKEAKYYCSDACANYNHFKIFKERSK